MRDDVERALAAAAAYAHGLASACRRPTAPHALSAPPICSNTHRCELMALAMREAGKSLPNAIAEVREAVDFLRYYAAAGRKATPNVAGARRRSSASARGIFRWRFSSAQVSAALAAGNVVLAKPAEQTPLIAHRAVQLLHEAGMPRGALQFLPGSGEIVGAALIADARVRGVIFTGSTEVAQHDQPRAGRRATRKIATFH